MRLTRKKQMSIELTSIKKIEMGINSIKKGIRSGDEVGTSLEYFFDKLKDLNKAMYDDLFMQYCIARLKTEKKEIQNIHS